MLVISDERTYYDLNPDQSTPSTITLNPVFQCDEENVSYVLSEVTSLAYHPR